ncbi:MAG: hypothetical protein Q7R35_16185 [Elusimicrobiota bacterium]|nr:hypothetical protein [Elusimicrobiota bacterium]
MRNLTAILILAVIATPLKAQNLSADITLNALMKSYSGSSALVQEYDGRKNDILNAGSIDFKAAASGEKSYLDLSGYGFGSGEGGAYIDLNVGALGIKASENTMVHRQPWVRTGMMVNGAWYFDPNTKPYNPLTVWNYNLTNSELGKNDISGQSFKRTEDNINVSYAPGDYGVHAGIWEEKEQGTIIARNYSKAMVHDLDREMRLLTLGFDAKIGDGAVAYDYVRGNFADNSMKVIVSTRSYPQYLQTAPAHTMEQRSLVFRSHPVAGYNLNGSLMSRTREGQVNGYKLGSYTATLAASHRFGKKLNVTVKGYGRTQQVTENDSWSVNTEWTNGVVSSAKTGATSYIDRATFNGEMLANYDFSDKLGFNLGYKLGHNYRRHVGSEVYSSSQTYTDGVYVEKNTQWNTLAEKNTQSIYTAGANVSLPMEAELGLGYKATRANVALVESMFTTEDEYSADLYVPIKGSLFFTGSAMVMSGANEKSHHTNSKDNQNTYLAGLDWSGRKYSAGANYAFDQVSSHSDLYYGGYSVISQANNIPSKRSIRNLGVLYRYANDTMGFHGSAKLSKEYTLTANSSYTRSLGKAPVNVVLTKAGDAGTVTDLEPSDIRIVSTGMNIKFSPVNNKSLTANLGLRRDQWTDKLNSENSGWVNMASVAVSSKF